MNPAHANPFRSDRLTAIPWLAPDPTQTAAGIAAAFVARGERAAIEGPHGVGKSTLMHAVGLALEAAGRSVVAVRLPASASNRVRRLTAGQAIRLAKRPDRPVVLFDGFEQLSRVQRWGVRRHCTRLLVTAHRPVGLPVAAAVRSSAETLDRLLDELAPGLGPAAHAFARTTLARHGGDVRQTLLAMYDAWADASPVFGAMPADRPEVRRPREQDRRGPV